MEYLKGYTFGFMDKRGDLYSERAKISLKKLVEETGTKTIIIPFLARQEKINSVEIDFMSDYTFSREEYIYFANYAKSLGLEVIVKVMVNSDDGIWRAMINFFDVDVICEPKWSEWFNSYNKLVEEAAEIAKEIESPMLCVGCETVCSDRREEEWRMVISNARKIYSGPITYNCDKYQEDNVKWWDAVDIISSSGYYPINEISNELDRIEKVVKKYNKPFFFMEVGCPAKVGSDNIPNDWTMNGEQNELVQYNWVKKVVEEAEKRPWFKGFGWWAWEINLVDHEQAKYDGSYSTYGKKGSSIIKELYDSK